MQILLNSYVVVFPPSGIKGNWTHNSHICECYFGKNKLWTCLFGVFI